MDLFFELSKENIDLPKDEILSCLKSEEIKYKIIDSNQDILLINIQKSKKPLKKIFDRLSYTYYVNKLLFHCPNTYDDIKKNALKTPLKEKGTIAIRCKNKTKAINSQKVIDILGDYYTKKRKVNLNNPDIEIRCFLTQKKAYVGIKLIRIDRSQFEKRKVQFRPFFSPISLHPKLARALVNLSCSKKGDFLLDPFCGTGGIILEAGLIGINVIGSDIEEKMIEGCKTTLIHYKIKNYKLFCSDIGSINKYVKKVDCVVTDFPYGISTTTKGEDKKLLYARAFEKISNIIKKDGRAVIGISNPQIIKYAKKLKYIQKYEFRAHKSLTRYFVVFEK